MERSPCREETINGGTPTLVGRLQLVDTESSSYSFKFNYCSQRGNRSNSKHGELWGWRGLKVWPIGSIWIVSGCTTASLRQPLGPPPRGGGRAHDVEYDITLAKTILPPDAPRSAT